MHPLTGTQTGTGNDGAAVVFCTSQNEAVVIDPE
jgi:hypothetical protein